MNAFDNISEPILAAYPDLDPADLCFVPPPSLRLGDIALRMFESAQKMGMAPVKLAARIAGTVRFGPEVTLAEAAGPYLNFRLDRGFFGRKIVGEILAREDYGSSGTGQGRRALIEHTSINPNASPHVGRARNAMIGDSLARLLRFEGYDLSVHYYVNDMGRQIALLALSCEDPAKLTFDEILDLYVKANARAERDPEFAAKGYGLLAAMEEGDAKVRQQFHDITDLCLQGQLAVLARLGAAYDRFDRESKYIKDPRLDTVVEKLREKDAVFVDEDQRLVVDLAKLGHAQEEGRYFVLMRANGSSMYGYRDLAYTIDKMDQGAELNLLVLGEDHKLYAQQQALILGAAGCSYPETIHYAYILLKEGKMSTRQGNVVLLSDFLNEATARSVEKVAEQYPELEPSRQKEIAEQVAVAAIRFAILRVGPNKNVIFDWDSCLSFTGDTGPYVQYSCARINSILRKLGDVPSEIGESFPIETDAEWSVLMKLAAFSDTVQAAVDQRNCASVAQFALETARLFTTFYHDCPVIQAPTDAQRIARAQVCAAVRRTLHNALDLLGIAALERM